AGIHAVFSRGNSASPQNAAYGAVVRARAAAGVMSREWKPGAKTLTKFEKWPPIPVRGEQSAPALPRFGQRLIGQLQRGPAVAATEHRLSQEAQGPGRDSKADAALSSDCQRAPFGVFCSIPFLVRHEGN